MYKYETSTPMATQWVFNGDIYINLNHIVCVHIDSNDEVFHLLGFDKKREFVILNENPFQSKEEAIEYFNKIILQSR